MSISTYRPGLSESAALIALVLVLFLVPAVSFGQREQNRGGGGGGGGTIPTPTPTPNPLPQTPPAADIIYRESFGAADLYRPSGGKGTMKETYLHTNLRSFWIEYPGSKDTQWLASDTGQTWRYCGASDNPYEMFSPIQMTLGYYSNGCVASEWFEVPTTNPTALMAFRAPSTPYEFSMNGYAAPIDGKYFAIGLSSPSALYSNLETSGSVVLVCRPVIGSPWAARFELYSGGINGTMLASIQSYMDGWNRMKIRVDPGARTISASANEVEMGTFPINIGAPRYAGFEGVGIADNFIIRVAQ